MMLNTRLMMLSEGKGKPPLCILKLLSLRERTYKVVNSKKQIFLMLILGNQGKISFLWMGHLVTVENRKVIFMLLIGQLN